MRVGNIGGFFRDLGMGGMLNMVVGGAAFIFGHTYISSKIAKRIAVDPADISLSEYNKAELMTGGALAVPSLVFGALRGMRGGMLDYESDMLDFVGNMIGGGLLYEAWNAIEIGVNMLEEVA